MTEPSISSLSFDRADLGVTGAITCSSCQQPITGTYYGWNGASVCPSCHETLAKEHEKPGSFLFALIYGGVVAALGAAAYYAIAAGTGMEFGLIAIFVGLGVGKAVRLGAGTAAKKRYRALAMLLTYLSITGTYVPYAFESAADVALVAALVIAFIAPFLMLLSMENIMGLVILGIGVYEAWKLSAPPDVVVQGPFTLATTPESAPVGQEPAAPVVPG